MNQFRKFIFLLALVFLPIPVMANTGGDFVEVEIHSLPSQGGIVKCQSVRPLIDVRCIYCVPTRDLSIFVNSENCIDANITVTEIVSNCEVFSVQEKDSMIFHSVQLPYSGLYQILISLSSGERFFGMFYADWRRRGVLPIQDGMETIDFGY